MESGPSSRSSSTGSGPMRSSECRSWPGSPPSAACAPSLAIRSRATRRCTPAFGRIVTVFGSSGSGGRRDRRSAGSGHSASWTRLTTCRCTSSPRRSRDASSARPRGSGSRIRSTCAGGTFRTWTSPSGRCGPSPATSRRPRRFSTGCERRGSSSRSSAWSAVAPLVWQRSRRGGHLRSHRHSPSSLPETSTMARMLTARGPWRSPSSSRASTASSSDTSPTSRGAAGSRSSSSGRTTVITTCAG